MENNLINVIENDDGFIAVIINKTNNTLNININDNDNIIIYPNDWCGLFGDDSRDIMRLDYIKNNFENLEIGVN